MFHLNHGCKVSLMSVQEFKDATRWDFTVKIQLLQRNRKLTFCSLGRSLWFRDFTPLFFKI